MFAFFFSLTNNRRDSYYIRIAHLRTVAELSTVLQAGETYGSIGLPTRLSQNQDNHKAEGPFTVEVSNPSKVGEGMSAHIVYEESFVSRRFSDFLGLHAKLCERHLSNGIIIPPAPEKDVLGTTKVKMSKDATIESEFVERRRIALTRFLYRVLSHPILRDDEDLRAFLTQQGDLPRATNTQLLSGASAKKMFRNFGDAIGKIAYKMDDPEEVLFVHLNPIIFLPPLTIFIFVLVCSSSIHEDLADTTATWSEILIAVHGCLSP
ncbi:unnamed protein product [Echinostoma caproni]|uniref:PX domain-containing protein n=1 Tax=Echinostoma caproni TaxID=27848 RepID=A0A183A1A8_9TREM|nr:unnamed protein product [Echinostoma caproni]